MHNADNNSIGQLGFAIIQAKFPYCQFTAIESTQSCDHRSLIVKISLFLMQSNDYLCDNEEEKATDRNNQMNCILKNIIYQSNDQNTVTFDLIRFVTSMN